MSDTPNTAVRGPGPPTPPTPPTPVPEWAQKMQEILTGIAGRNVSYAKRIKSSRYFVWQDDDAEDLCADNIHAEEAVRGSLDLFTGSAFDRWAREIGPAFDEAGIIWEKTGVTYEPDTGLFHHSWDWTVV